MSAKPSRTAGWPLWKRELAWASGLIAFGLLALPPMVYGVGQIVVGDYAPDRDLWDLLLHVWSDAAAAGPLAWTLVLSPYALVQSWRAFRRLRHGGTVNSVNNFDVAD